MRDYNSNSSFIEMLSISLFKNAYINSFVNSQPYSIHVSNCEEESQNITELQDNYAILWNPNNINSYTSSLSEFIYFLNNKTNIQMFLINSFHDGLNSIDSTMDVCELFKQIQQKSMTTTIITSNITINNTTKTTITTITTISSILNISQCLPMNNIQLPIFFLNVNDSRTLTEKAKTSKVKILLPSPDFSSSIRSYFFWILRSLQFLLR